MAARYQKTSRLFRRRNRRSALKKSRRQANQPRGPRSPRGPRKPDDGPQPYGVDWQLACCVDLDTMKVVCPDPNDPRHGANVSDIGEDTPEGLLVAWQSATTSGSEYMQPCGTRNDCCYDAVQGIIVCQTPSNPLHGQKADVVEQLDNGMVYVCFGAGSQPGDVPCFDPKTNKVIGGQWDGMSPPGGVSYSEDGTMAQIMGLDPGGVIDPILPVCTPGQQCFRIPLCTEQPPVDCCYDAIKGVLVCDDPALNGQSPTLISEGTDENGKPFVVVQLAGLNGGNRTQIPLCPEIPPPDCCYDIAAGVLRCPGNPELDGLAPNGVVQITDDMVAVQHPDLPGGAWDFPLCIDETPPDCCYDGKLQVLVCPNDPDLNGKPAGVIKTFQGEDGRTWVQVAWDGGGASMPLCTEECPPQFCCVNIDTMTFVCADGALNDQPADVVDIITVAGFNTAVLSDGTRVPVCGGDCPPPKYCPPGLWMSPDGECTTPECPPPEDCPPCPPGEGCPPQTPCPPQMPCPPQWQPPGWQPPQNGDCQTCPFPLVWGSYKPQPGDRNDNPWWKKAGHCCEECALGKPCAGPQGGCDCDGKHDNPHTPMHRARTRIRRHARRTMRKPSRYRRAKMLLGL